MTAAVEAWLGVSLCVAAAGTLPRSAGARSLRGLAGRYDRSRPGRRLQRRLEAAQIEMTASTWRVAQSMVLVPALLAASLVGLGSPAGVAAAAGVVRGGGRAVLWTRRGRRSESIEAAIPGLARTLAAEIRRGATLADALTTAARPAAGAGGPAHLLLARAAAAAAAGDDPVAAFDAGAGAEVQPAGAALRRLGTALALVRRGGGPTALHRVAVSVEERRRLRRQSSAGFAEVRAASLVVPVLATVVAAVLLSGEPSASATVVTPLGLLVLGTCATVCAGGILLVRRLTSV